MKQKIQDIRDITYSRELYEAKPKPWISAFLYIVLTIFVLSIGFMAFFKIDVVVKGVGVVRPNRQVSTIKALKSGIISKICYEEGQEVESGEILMVIDYTEQEIARERLMEEIKSKKEEIDLVERYIEALKTGENTFDKDKEALYFNKFEKFKWNQQIGKDQLNYSKELAQAEISSLEKSIAELGAEKSQIQALIQSINNEEKQPKLKGYYEERLQKYQLDYANLKRQYEDKIFEIKNGQNLEFSQKNLIDVERNLYGHRKIQEAIQREEEILHFEEEKYSAKELTFFQNQYKEYQNRKKHLQESYLASQENYELYRSLEKLAVTKSQIQEAERNMLQAKMERDNYVSEYTRGIVKTVSNLELELLQIKFQKEKEVSKDTLLENIKIAREQTLAKLTKDEIVWLKEQQKEISNREIQLGFALEKAKVESKKNSQEDTTGEYANILYLKSAEILTAMENMENLKEGVKGLEASLATVEQEINHSVLVASQSGKVNIITEMAEGDQILTGTEIFTIVPQDSTTYKVQIVVNNQDIAKIKVGDTIKYNFSALPQKEYGNLTGKIIKISSDVKYDMASQRNYYSVEASLNEREVYSYNGEKAQVKVGMVNEARVISQQKSILRFVLEKINLLD